MTSAKVESLFASMLQSPERSVKTSGALLAINQACCWDSILPRFMSNFVASFNIFVVLVLLVLFDIDSRQITCLEGLPG